MLLYFVPVTKSSNISSLTIKSIIINSYSLASIRSSYSSLYSLYLYALALAYLLHLLITFLIYYLRLLMQQYYQSVCIILLILGCPCISRICISAISSLLIYSRITILSSLVFRYSIVQQGSFYLIIGCQIYF